MRLIFAIYIFLNLFLNALFVLVRNTRPSSSLPEWQQSYRSYEYQIPNAQVLAVHPMLSLDVVQLRVLVDDLVEGETKQSIKYVDLRASTWPSQPIVSLPSLPPGDWNQATMEVTEDAKAYDTDYHFMPWPGLSEPWHPLNIDYLDLRKVKSLKTVSNLRRVEKADFLQVVTHPVFNRPVLMKISSFPNLMEQAISDAEVSIYKRIEGLGIAPRFLGYVTEHGRVIGFLLEYLDDAINASEVWNEETKRAVCNIQSSFPPFLVSSWHYMSPYPSLTRNY